MSPFAEASGDRTRKFYFWNTGSDASTLENRVEKRIKHRYEGLKVKKSKSIQASQESLYDELLVEPPQIRRKRILWFLFLSAVVIGILFWSLSQSKPKPSSPEAISQGQDSPDAVIEKFHLVSTVQGQKRWTMDADNARFYQSQKEAYADVIYAQYYKNDKLISTLTSEKAIINTETNATQATGHVELIVENGSKLETEKLNWEPDTYLIKTDSRVHIYKGMDDITATGLVADTALNNIRFIKDVNTKVRDTREIENFGDSKKF